MMNKKLFLILPVLLLALSPVYAATCSALAPPGTIMNILSPVTGQSLDNFNGIEVVLEPDPIITECYYSWDNVTWTKLGEDCGTLGPVLVYDALDDTNGTFYAKGGDIASTFHCNATPATGLNIHGTLTSGEKIERLKLILGFLAGGVLLIWWLFRGTRYAMLGDLILGALGVITATSYSHVLTWLIAFILLTNLILKFIDRITYMRW